ncbi:MAG: hypothetical protein JNJ40_13900 [Bacteroidia bacterium]|nr:hypothetical protein [Bacteroidia bacterium]
MKISINEPCHENWEKMSANEQGAFCLSCQKNVVDFSKKTLSQIKEFFENKKDNVSVCGRFEEDQLTQMSFDDFFEQFRTWKFFQKLALVTFFVFGLSLFSQGQNTTKHPKMGKVAYTPTDTIKKCEADTTHTPKKQKASTKGSNKKQSKKDQPPHIVGEIMIEDKNK